MKYLSLFSGIGGFELGIQQAYEQNNESNGNTIKSEEQSETYVISNTGDITDSPSGIRDGRGEHPTCIGFSEIDKYATKIYQSHFPEHKNYGDITKINPEELPDFDLLCGGFPCQAFSIAGKRRGFEDTRGTLFFDIARILRVKQPSLLLLENVKGLLSHDQGRTFRTIISTLDELGYDLQWQVLNSKNFGVPQNRERVFIIGHLRGTSRPEVFPIGESQQEGDGTLGLQDIRQIAGTLRATDYKGTHNNIRETAHTVRSSGRASGIDKKQNWDSYLVEGKIRRLTPTECARLQGFPDDWHKIEGISDTQAYKCYGNAVTVNVIREIIKRLVIHLPQK